jgi:hypothetical protein
MRAALLAALLASGCGAATSEITCRRDPDCPGAAVCEGARCLDPALLGTPALLAARRVVLWPEDDAVVSRAVASQALGPTDFLSVGGGGGASAAFRSYLRFDLGAVASKRPVQRAELRLRTRADPPGLPRASCLFGVYLAGRPWRGARLTWENQPGPSGDEKAWTVVPGAAEAEVRIDVTSFVSELVQGMLPNHGFVLVARREDARARVVAYSSRSPRREVRPRLEVLF